MNLSYKNKLYMQGGALVALLAASVWVSLFLFGLITQADATVSDSQKELASLSIRQEQIAAIAKEYEGMQQLFMPLEGRFLPPKERLRFIMLVEQLATDAGVLHEIEAVDEVPAGGAEQGGSIANASGVPSLHFNINVFGDFPNALRFIYLLENSNYYLTVEKAQVMHSAGNAPKKEGVVLSQDSVKAQLVVKVYTQ